MCHAQRSAVQLAKLSSVLLKLITNLWSQNFSKVQRKKSRTCVRSFRDAKRLLLRKKQPPNKLLALAEKLSVTTQYVPHTKYSYKKTCQRSVLVQSRRSPRLYKSRRRTSLNE